MEDIRVTQRTEFECCYLIPPHSVEAHRYRVEAEVKAPQRYEDEKCVMRFETLKELLKGCVPDGCFIYDVNQVHSFPYKIGVAIGNEGYPTCALKYPISAETICATIAAKLQDRLTFLYPGVTLESVKLRETGDSFVSWTRS